MLPAHERLAEIFMLQAKRKLTPDEEIEFYQCLRVNAEYAYKLSKLHNLSLTASMTNDTEWHHEICRDIEELELKYSRKNKTK